LPQQHGILIHHYNVAQCSFAQNFCHHDAALQRVSQYYKKTLTLHYRQNNETTYVQLGPMLCDQNIFMFNLVLPEPAGYFNTCNGSQTK